MPAKPLHILMLGVLLVVPLISCEEDVAGPADLQQPFSVYGIINPQREMQTLLVSPIENLLNPLDGSIDARVRSIDLTTGNEHLWRDSVVTNELGQIDHVFWARFQPAHGSRHRIEVVRSDGKVTSAETVVPPPVTIEQFDRRSRYLDVDIKGDDVRLVRIDVVYGVHAFYAYPGVDFLGPYARYAFSRDGQEERDDEGWSLRIDLHEDYEMMKSLYFIDHFGRDGFIGWDNPVCDGLGLADVTLSLTVGTGDWDPPGGIFDANVLVQAGVLSNVENGFGFVAAGYDQEAALLPSTGTINHTGFFDFILDREPVIRGCGNYVGE